MRESPEAVGQGRGTGTGADGHSAAEGAGGTPQRGAWLCRVSRGKSEGGSGEGSRDTRHGGDHGHGRRDSRGQS